MGNAVVRICLSPAYIPTPEGVLRQKFADVLNYGCAIKHAGEVHSNEESIFVWTDNALRTLDDLNEDELSAAKKLFDSLYERRIKKTNG